MSKRELYEGIVAEVEADINLIKPDNNTSYIEAVQKGTTTITLPEGGVLLKSPTSAFADYAVRDTLLTKAMESEEFAFVLINKIGNAVKAKHESNSVTQDDIEALVSASQVCVMWEQFGTSSFMSELAEFLVKKYELREPNLNTITKKLLEARDNFPFATTRKQLLADLTDTLIEDLDKNE
jgi:hypothetical protein